MSTQDNLIKIFNYALNQEKTGKSFFETSIQRLGVGAAVSAFEKLVAQEEKHIQFITRILADLKGEGSTEAALAKDVSLDEVDFFDQRAQSEFLEQCVIGSMIPDVTVFNVAWMIEKDLAEFYENAARQTEGEASESLAMLSKWERGHELFFRRFRDRLNESYAQMPWGG